MKATVFNPGYDFEYYIQGAVDGETVTYPVTGGSGTGNINKTVLTVEKVDFGEPQPAQRVAMTPDVVGEMNQYLRKFYIAWIAPAARVSRPQDTERSLRDQIGKGQGCRPDSWHGVTYHLRC